MEKKHLKLVNDMYTVATEYGFQTEFQNAINSRDTPDETEFIGWVSMEFLRLSKEHQVPGTEERGRNGTAQVPSA